MRSCRIRGLPLFCSSRLSNYCAMYWYGLSTVRFLGGWGVFILSGCCGMEHQAVQWVPGVSDASTLRPAFDQRRGCKGVEGPHSGTSLMS